MVKVVEPSMEIWTPLDNNYIMRFLERCARNCYKSEGMINDDSAERMIRKLIELKHDAMLEHYSITVKMTCDLGCYKDITRHRHASFAIESTRWCNYAKDKFGSEISVVRPINMEVGSDIYNAWLKNCEDMEKSYLDVMSKGGTVDQGRMILNQSTKADVIMTCNIREWRHVLRLRCEKSVHPTVQNIMRMILIEFKKHLPVLFEDIHPDIVADEGCSIAAE